MPDALAKTVPIWCAVMNQLLFGVGKVEVPEHVVGESERAQMEERLGGWVEDAKVGLLTLVFQRDFFLELVADRVRLST